jgi:DNA-directed RNA polymerase specialized sigma24 family protein
VTVKERDAEFVRRLDSERATLQGTAYLLMDEPRAAASLLDSTLAQLYAQRVPATLLRWEALRRLVSQDAQVAPMTWTPATFELVDGPPRSVKAGIAADLSLLSRDQRTAMVLERYTGLPSGQIADLLTRSVEEVQVLARQARTALTAGHPERQTDDKLTAELRSAIPYDWLVSRGAAADLQRGHRLVRRRQWRVGSLAVAAVVALVVLASQLWLEPVRAPEATAPVVRASATPTPTATLWPIAPASCDARDKTCQTAILQDWRNEMARVASSHLDLDRKNLFGYDLSADADPPTPSFWSGQGGAVTVDLSIDGGVTHVRVQIATSSAYALRCGQATHHPCVSMRFMDGNSVGLAGSDLGQGFEAQYSPDGVQVITAIARDAAPGGAPPGQQASGQQASGQQASGRESSVTRDDLVKLVEDDRLHLPSV